MKSLDIELLPSEQGNLYYFVGDTISGRIRIHDLSHLESIWVTLKGYSRVTLQVRTRYQVAMMVDGPGGMIGMTTRVDATFCEASSCIWQPGESKSSAQPSSSDTLDVPFCISIPTHQTDRSDIPLPSSFTLPTQTLNFADIMYELHIEARRQGKFHLNKKETIPVRILSAPEESPSYELYEQRPAQTSALIELNYKSSNNPLSLQANLSTHGVVHVHPTEPTRIEYTLTCSIVSSANTAPPNEAMLTNLDISANIQVGRKAYTRPVDNSNTWQNTWSTGIAAHGKAGSISKGRPGDVSRVLKSYIEVPAGESTTHSSAVDVDLARTAVRRVTQRIRSP